MIRKAAPEDSAAVAGLALLLWPDHSLSELEAEFAQLLTQRSAAVFLFLDEGIPVGFAQCQLRHDYVEGTIHSPVGYLGGHLRPGGSPPHRSRREAAGCL